VPSLTATGALLAVGAFATTPRAAVPTAGILIGGAMVATTLTGRRLVEALRDDEAEIEARLCLGDDVRAALSPAIRRAIHTGVIPVLDQTRSVGLVTLPGTFVGLILGGASPAQAAATQLVVLLALVAVELVSGLVISELILRAVTAPGERVVAPGPT
jgi:putative ABC transport system permease protein